MRLLIVDSSLGLRGIGGAARVAGSLFHDLRKKGISTYYLGQRSDYIGNDRNAFFIDGGSFAQKQARQHLSGALRPIAESWPARVAYYSVHSITKHSNREMGSWVSKVKPDLVVANSVQDYLLLKHLLQSLGDAKLIYIDHANLSVSAGRSLDYNNLGFTVGTGPYAGLAYAKRRFFSFFDGIVALNADQYKTIRGFNKNVTVIHNSALLSGAKVSAQKLRALQRSIGIRSGDNVVLYLGRLSEQQKNVGTLIRAFRPIQDQRMKLLVVGDGKSKDLYERLSRGDSRISMVGRVDDSMVPCYYSLADLYVLPSIWEGFNLSMIEAAHFGAPLLLSTSSINEDLAGRFGGRLYTFDPYRSDDLKWKIERYFKDPELQKRLRTLSKEIDAEYSKKKQINGYAAALKAFHQKGKFPKVTPV